MRSWALILALWLAGLGAAAQYAKISVSFEALAALYPEAGLWVSFLVSGVGGVGIVFGVFAGAVVSEIGYRRALLGGLLFGAVLSAYQASLPGFLPLLLSRLLEGLSHLLIVVAAPTLIAQLAPARGRGAALMLWSTFFGVAFAGLVLLAARLPGAGGVSALFAGHAVWMGAAALLLWRGLPRDDAPRPRAVAMRGFVSAHLVLYRAPNLSAPALGWLFYTFCFVSLLTLLPPYIAPQIRTALIFAMPIVSIATSLTLGLLLLRRVSAVQVIILGFVIAALAAAALIGLPGHPVACLVLAVGFGLVQGASFAAVPQLAAKMSDRARANGGLAQMGNLGNTAGTPVLAWSLLQGGYTGGLALIVAMLVAGALAHIYLAWRRQNVRAMF